MNHWAIRDTVWSEGTIELVGKRLPAIKPGDRLVRFRRESTVEAYFLEQAAAAEIKRLDDKQEKELATLIVTAPESAPLVPPRALSDLRFSLGRVTNYDDPARHFTRACNKLTEMDYVTISTGKIFWARTAFGIYVESLPEDAFREFVAECASAETELVFAEANYSKLWAFLRSFLEANYIRASEILESIKKEISTLTEDTTPAGLHFDTIGIRDPGATKSLRLAGMHARLADFCSSIAESEGSPSILESLTERALDDPRAAEFERFFRNQPWPTPKTLR